MKRNIEVVKNTTAVEINNLGDILTIRMIISYFLSRHNVDVVCLCVLFLMPLCRYARCLQITEVKGKFCFLQNKSWKSNVSSKIFHNRAILS